MKRRAVLTTLGTSTLPLAGCTGSGSDDGSGQSPTGDANREVQISTVDDVPTDAPLEPSVTVVQSSVTAEQPAQIRVTVQNVADHPVWNTIVRIPVFDNFTTDEGPEGQRLVLLQPEEQHDTVSEQCWRADLTESEYKHAYSNVATDIRYGAGESRATEFDIYGHPENANDCLAPGEYPIENRYTITEESEADEATWQYNWGFRITVIES